MEPIASIGRSSSTGGTAVRAGPAGTMPRPVEQETDIPRLVRQAQAGETAAFDQLIRLSARMLYANIYLYTADRHQTEDVLQETYLTAWRSIYQFKESVDDAALRRWLLSIARSAFVDQLRRQSRRKRGGKKKPQPLPDAAETIEDPRHSPLESYERQEAHERALALLETLPEEYRQPIAMRYLAGADYATVRQQLGLSDGSLRGLLQRGMARLRRVMAEDEP